MLAALISPATANSSRRAGDAAVSWANWQCGGAEEGHANARTDVTVHTLDPCKNNNTAALGGGVATFTTSTLPAGSSRITANYGGTPNYSASSASVTQVVQ